jgi:hypothetical protein
MRPSDPEPFEVELQKLKPARPPEEFIAHLAAAMPAKSTPQMQPPSSRSSISSRWWLIPWLAPGAVAVAVVLAIWFRHAAIPGNQSTHQPAPQARKSAIKADDVEIDRQLLAAFDAVARLPGGEPVRFRCREWVDQVVLRDSAQGLIIEQRTPRLEVVPVGFETY